jgi:hypothetical protein
MDQQLFHAKGHYQLQLDLQLSPAMASYSVNRYNNFYETQLEG